MTEPTERRADVPETWEHQHMTALRNAICATIPEGEPIGDDFLVAQPGKLAAEVKRLQERIEHLDAELNKGDSWAWIRSKFEKSRAKFRWYKPRTDNLSGTRYEVMGWLHCLFADAAPTVFIDITLEHQKRTDEAEAAVAALTRELAEARTQFEAERVKNARLSAPVSDEDAQVFSTSGMRSINKRLQAMIVYRATGKHAHEFRCHDPGDQGDGCLHDEEGRREHPCSVCGLTAKQIKSAARASAQPQEERHAE